MDELELQVINKEYKYSMNVFGNNAYVASKFDEWEIKQIRKSLFMLNHINNITRHPTRCRKMRKHIQNKNGKKICMHNLEDVFKYIKDHDNFISDGRNTAYDMLTPLFEEIK